MVKRKQQGFTIIEVVLVLAIAGLIFLMVFIALPALQRGQRDTGRKNDVSIVASSLNTYLSNNKGSFSGITGTGGSTALQGYIDNLSQYDKAKVIVTNGGASITAATDQIDVVIGRKCGAITGTPATTVATVSTGASTRNAAIITALENNGSAIVGYCQDF